MTVEIQKNQNESPLLAKVTPGGCSGLLLFTFLILKKKKHFLFRIGGWPINSVVIVSDEE